VEDGVALMPRRKKDAAERLRAYQANIIWGKRAAEPYWKEWRRIRHFYEGDQWDDDTGAEPENAVSVNQIGPIINTILPSIYTNRPRPRAKALRPQDAQTAPLVEQMITYDWERINADDELRLAALDMLLFGNGLVLVGYEYQEARVPRDPADIQADLEMMRAIVQSLGGGTPPANLMASGELDQQLQQAQGMQAPQFLHGYGGGGIQRVPEPMQFGAPGGGPPAPGGYQQGAAPGQGQQTLEQGQGQLYQAQAGQQQALPPPPGPSVTPGLEVPANAPPALAALMREESGGPPAEDAFNPQQGLPLQDGLPDMGTGPGSQPIDPRLLPTEEEMQAAIPTETTQAIVDDLFVERVSPFDVVVDPEARSLKEARWVAVRRWETLEEVKANPNYSNTKDLNGTTMTAQDVSWDMEDRTPPPGYPDMGGQPDYAMRVELWKYYNLHEGTVCTLVLDHDKFLEETSWSMPFDGGPLVQMRDYVVPDKLWGYGEARLMMALQIELNRTRTQIINHNRRFNRKLLYNERAIGADGKQALESRIDGALIRVINDVDLSKAVLPLPDSPLPVDRYQLNNIIESDLTQVTGISDYERGAFQNLRRTATEASIIQDSSSLRQQDKLRRVEDAATEVAKRMKSLAQMFYDHQRWILVTGQGWELPISFNKTDILGDFDISVDAGSTQPISQQQQQQSAERLYQLLASNPVVNLPEITRELLRAHGMTNPDRFINQQAVMQMQMMGQFGGGQPGQPGQQQGLPGNQPGQLGPGTPQEVQGGVQGGAAAAGVPGAIG